MKFSGCLRKKCNYVFVHCLRERSIARRFFFFSQDDDSYWIVLQKFPLRFVVFIDFMWKRIACENWRKYIYENSSHTYGEHVQIVQHYIQSNQSNRESQVETINLTQFTVWIFMCRGSWYMFIAHAHHFNHATRVNMFGIKWRWLRK